MVIFNVIFRGVFYRHNSLPIDKTEGKGLSCIVFSFDLKSCLDEGTDIE